MYRSGRIYITIITQLVQINGKLIEYIICVNLNLVCDSEYNYICGKIMAQISWISLHNLIQFPKYNGCHLIETSLIELIVSSEYGKG